MLAYSVVHLVTATLNIASLDEHERAEREAAAEAKRGL